MTPFTARLTIGILLIAAPVSQASAQASETVIVGVAAPLSGAGEILGRQIVAGASRAANEADAKVVEADTACNADGGRRAADALIAARVSVAVGFLCAAALEAALPSLKAAAIPVIDVGTRAARIQRHREKEGALVWRLAPGSTAEAQALADHIREHWASAPFAMVDDGTPYARDLADTVRHLLEESGLRPAVTDTYRPAEEKQFPLVRRLQQSGATRVLFLGTRGDVAVILRDAGEIGFTIEALGGESLLDADEDDLLPAGTVALAAGFDVDWTPSENPPEDEGYARIARIGTEIAIGATRRAAGEKRSIADMLDHESFVTSSGLVRFQGNGTADVVPFRAYRWDGTRFVAEPEG